MRSGQPIPPTARGLAGRWTTTSARPRPDSRGSGWAAPMSRARPGRPAVRPICCSATASFTRTGGRRLRGTAEAYEPHCRGAACGDFAPPELIKLRLVAPSHHTAAPPNLTPSPAEYTLHEPPPAIVTPRTPLVSCVMPTRDWPIRRPGGPLLSNPDYPNTELVIVDDGGGSLRRGCHPTREFAWFAAIWNPVRRRHTIGALRNIGGAAAHGEIIILWDDDDWHGPTRVSNQVEPILAGAADVTGLADVDWFEPTTGRAWRLTPNCTAACSARTCAAGRSRSAIRCGGGSTTRPLAGRRRGVPGASRPRRRRLPRLSGKTATSTSGTSTTAGGPRLGQAVLRTGWTPIPVPSPQPKTVRSTPAWRGRTCNPEANPLVSCIMLTRNRRAYVGQAIEYFLRQDCRPRN